MPYTYKSLAFAWLIMFALFAVSASGVARGGWFVLLLAVAVAVPALVLRSSVQVATASVVVAASSDRVRRAPGVRSSTRDQPSVRLSDLN